jgi:hypothetical protein
MSMIVTVTLNAAIDRTFSRTTSSGSGPGGTSLASAGRASTSPVR